MKIAWSYSWFSGNVRSLHVTQDRLQIEDRHSPIST